MTEQENRERDARLAKIAVKVWERERAEDAARKVLDLLDATSASLETVMLQFGKQMEREDRRVRTALVEQARAMCDTLLRP